MHYLIEDTVIQELERGASRLESMGTILTQLCDPDGKRPDLSSLADLGSVIARQSMELINLLAEKLRLEPMPDLQRTPNERRPSTAVFTNICFVPEIPSD